MTELEPTEVTNLDIYGRPELSSFLGTSRRHPVALRRRRRD